MVVSYCGDFHATTRVVVAPPAQLLPKSAELGGEGGPTTFTNAPGHPLLIPVRLLTADGAELESGPFMKGRELSAVCGLGDFGRALRASGSMRADSFGWFPCPLHLLPLLQSSFFKKFFETGFGPLLAIAQAIGWQMVKMEPLASPSGRRGEEGVRSGLSRGFASRGRLEMAL